MVDAMVTCSAERSNAGGLALSHQMRKILSSHLSSSSLIRPFLEMRSPHAFPSFPTPAFVARGGQVHAWPPQRIIHGHIRISMRPQHLRICGHRLHPLHRGCVCEPHTSCCKAFRGQYSMTRPCARRCPRFKRHTLRMSLPSTLCFPRLRGRSLVHYSSLLMTYKTRRCATSILTVLHSIHLSTTPSRLAS